MEHQNAKSVLYWLQVKFGKKFGVNMEDLWKTFFRKKKLVKVYSQKCDYFALKRRRVIVN